MSTNDAQMLPDLEKEVELELSEAQSSHEMDGVDATPREWLFDPTEIEREEVGLRNILGAALELDGESPSLFP